MSDKPKISANIRNNIGISLGINELMIKTLVHSFYTKVRNDPFIGPIFHEKIGDDWDKHLAIMCDFWSSVALSSNRYKGTPMIKHINLPGLNKEHFRRWLSLFEENAHNVCSKEIAEFFIDKAKRIAESLMLGIAYYNEKFKT
jgi:hemoglobin